MCNVMRFGKAAWRKKTMAIALAALCFVFVFCNSGGKFTDSRDGKIYRVVKIGTQTWTAENMNYETANSTCYDEDPSNCAKYGRLYNWNDAKGACPAGWHLPTDAEWTQLTDAVGVSSKAGRKLKSKTGWNYEGNGTDDYEFSALPGGFGDSNGYFYYAGDYGRWWSATEFNASNAWRRYMDCRNEYVGRDDYGKTLLFSVRCVRD